MHTQKSNFQTMKYFFYILMIAILGWFCFMQLFGANEQNYNDPSKSIIYSGINVNLKMYSFDHLRMYNIDHINTFCSRR